MRHTFGHYNPSILFIRDNSYFTEPTQKKKSINFVAINLKQIAVLAKMVIKFSKLKRVQRLKVLFLNRFRAA